MNTEYLTPALERWRARTDGLLLVVAIGSLPILLLEFERHDLRRGDQIFIDAVNIVVFVVFLLSYVVELTLAQRRLAFVRDQWLAALIVLAQAVALVPSLAAFGVLRILRTGRVVRSLATLARLLAIGGLATRDLRRVLRRRAGSFAMGIAGFTWLCSAAAFTLAEGAGPDGRVESFADALWWSSATITTVGYGDIAPVTAAGRLVGVATMLVGISTFAIITAKVAQFLVRSDEAERASGDQPTA